MSDVRSRGSSGGGLILAGLLVVAALPGCGGTGGGSTSPTNTGGPAPQPPTILTTDLLPAEKGQPYQGRIEAAGGSLSFAYSITAGALPAGLALDPMSGAIAGVPVAAGDFGFTTTVVDNNLAPLQASKPLQLLVNPGPDPSKPTVRTKASRLAGVAPLSVFFDATETTSRETSQPFHHLHYSWYFGDPDSRRPGATGPMAAHVFEKPGTFTVTLTVREPDGSTAKETVAHIAVEEPDQAFGGERTVCVAASNDFAGAPAGCRRLVTSSFADALRQLGPGKRVLLRRGHTFLAATGGYLGGAGPAHLGAFGPGTGLDARGIYANNPVVQVTGGEPALSLAGQDLRLQDLHFRTTASGQPVGLNAAHQVREILVQRVTTESFRTGLLFSHSITAYYNEPVHDGITVADSTFRDSAEYGIYLAGQRLAVLGNEVDRVGSQHCLRIPYALKAVIGDNRILWPGPAKHAVKIHGLTWSQYQLATRQLLIAGNELAAAVDWAVCLGPQNAQSDERVQEVILERNTFLAQKSNQVLLYLNSTDTTVRNNLFLDGGGCTTGLSCIAVCRRGVEPAPAGAAILNNTFHGETDHGGQPVTLARVDAHDGGPALLWNNLLFAPKVAQLALKSGGAAVDAAGNLVGKDPRFANPAQRDLSLLPGSPAIDAGVEAPVLDDFEGSLRPKAGTKPDVGAYEHH